MAIHEQSSLSGAKSWKQSIGEKIPYPYPSHIIHLPGRDLTDPVVELLGGSGLRYGLPDRLCYPVYSLASSSLDTRLGIADMTDIE